MRSLIQALIQALVEYPQDVEVNEISGKTLMHYEIKCRKSDMGKIIGKEGYTIQSIRNILNAIASKNKHRIIISLIE
jgi:predicted RNA-binding protein YlqC (UPF0109 family)